MATAGFGCGDRCRVPVDDPCFAGCHVLNGNGDATGLEWIGEAGLLTTAIATTNTHSVGVVRDALIAHEHATLAGRTMQAEDGREVPGLEGSRLLKALEQVGWKAQG